MTISLNFLRSLINNGTCKFNRVIIEYGEKRLIWNKKVLGLLESWRVEFICKNLKTNDDSLIQRDTRFRCSSFGSKVNETPLN